MSEWTVVRTLGTEEDAALLAGYLEAAGIEARVESHSFHQEPVNFGVLGDVRVMVPAESLAEAERLLAAQEAESAADETSES
jgi:hypothetical protein